MIGSFQAAVLLPVNVCWIWQPFALIVLDDQDSRGLYFNRLLVPIEQKFEEED